MTDLVRHEIGHSVMHRPGSVGNGVTVTERYSADFTIDGKSLLRLLCQDDANVSDMMGCFVQGFQAQNALTIPKLVCESEPDTETGRVLLYVCPECGDIGCGAFSARVESVSDRFTWRDFAYENGYEDAVKIEGLGPFMFEAGAYRNALLSAATFTG
jgi:hypothetical protein